MNYPSVEVRLDKLEQNAAHVLTTCYRHEIEPTAVTKVVSAHPDLVRTLHRTGFKSMADSRLGNLRSLRENAPGVQLGLLRLPAISRAPEVVSLADVSLNSEIETLRALDSAAGQRGINHGAVIMIDVGDLREGVWPDDVEAIGGQLAELSNIDVVGVGTNLACYGGVIPGRENMDELLSARGILEAALGRRVPMVSAGNSANWTMLEGGELPAEVNNLRLGEVIFLGNESVYRRRIEGMYGDVFTLKAEIIELKVKPSMPIGERGQDAFGKSHDFEDKGERLRAIAAVGRADVEPEGLEPCDPGIEILGASSDHLILDVEDAEEGPVLGDIVSFTVRGYSALLYLFMSPYVDKIMAQG